MNNQFSNLSEKLSYSNDKISVNKFNDAEELIYSADYTEYSNWGDHKNFSIDFGESIDTDGIIGAFINTDKKGGGRFGDTRYIDNIGKLTDICKYTFYPSSVNNPPIVSEPEVIDKPIFDIGGGDGSEGISWSRHQYVADGFLSGINIHHWEMVDNDLGITQGNIFDYFGNEIDLRILTGLNIGIMIVRVPIAEKDTDLERRKMMRLDLVLKGFIPVNYILVILRKYV